LFTTLFRIIKYGLQGFWRNGWLSTTTLFVMILTLLAFIGLMLFNVLTNTALTSLQGKIDISVYFKTAASEDDILSAKSSLESLAEVKKIEYISRDQALEIFKNRHRDNPTISQALEELKTNPLNASLNIKARDPKEYAVIAGYLEGEPLKALIEKVTYAQNAVIIERLDKIIKTGEQAGLILTIVLTLAAVLVTFNTIRLAIYSNREEIGIMRLVGASNRFTRGPYIVEGIIYGLSAGFLSILMAAPAVYLVSPYINVFIPEIKLWGYFISNLVKLLGYQILFGVGLGIVSSWIAVRRYLRI
jgi:cell division transport system permease protein